MRKVLFGLGWGFVFLAAGYDAHYAWQHRAVLQEWELNPFARWGARELGLPAVFAVKFAGLAFAAWVAGYCVRRQRRLGEPLTLATVCVYAALSWHYVADHYRGDAPDPDPVVVTGGQLVSSHPGLGGWR